ncbi:MAG TPA: SRPBCC family protein, partial [Fimbriimonadaceae bacterium]|nr:SRPBCC family protein [Fimbriimonadaceae bacterium]
QAAPWNRKLHVSHSITINKPREDVYRFWRRLENLPRFMAHLEFVRENDPTRSHWCAKGPAGRHVEWDAEITQDKPRQLIAWRSLDGSEVFNEGEVHFFDAPGGRGTEVHVSLRYAPPGGTFGALMARLYGEDPQSQIEDDLRRMKALLETGEIPTIAGQPRGKGGRAPIGARMVDLIESRTPAQNPSQAA